MMTRALATKLPLGTILLHKRLTNADGSPLRARINGICHERNERNEQFRLPMKHGLYKCFYITLENAADWSYNDD